MSRTVVIAGATGVVGNAAVDHFSSRGWDVVAISRRPPETEEGTRFRHVAVDLRDAEATRAAVGGLEGVSRVIYAALFEKPGLVRGWTEQDQMQTNLAMLQNLLTPLIEAGSLEHLSLLQGTKAYGSHLHEIRIPARESQPRDPHENFYWLQEDWAREQAAAHDFAITILRPQVVVGAAHGVAMNPFPVIGVYAALCRELGRPCGFPGGARFVWEAIDSRIIAKCFEWAGGAPAAAGEIFNITNGDVFAWRDLWPSMMATLGVEAGPDEPVKLADFLPAHADVWDRIVQRHGLRPLSLDDVVGLAHFSADYMFAYGQEAPRPKFVSTIKLRQAGFATVIDTEDSFNWALSTLIGRNVLPGAAS